MILKWQEFFEITTDQTVLSNSSLRWPSGLSGGKNLNAVWSISFFHQKTIFINLLQSTLAGAVLVLFFEAASGNCTFFGMVENWCKDLFSRFRVTVFKRR